jgi:hypothetical protein
VPANGMLDGLWAFNLEKPCEDCYITAMQADLQYADGRSANIEDGAWLHHIVVYNGLGFTPGSKKDVVCSGSIYSLGMGYPNRIFASGNERAAMRLNGKYKFGMPVDKGDMFHLLYDLVNQSNKEQVFYVQMVSRAAAPLLFSLTISFFFPVCAVGFLADIFFPSCVLSLSCSCTRRYQCPPPDTSRPRCFGWT